MTRQEIIDRLDKMDLLEERSSTLRQQLQENKQQRTKIEQRDRLGYKVSKEYRDLVASKAFLDSAIRSVTREIKILCEL